MLLRSASLFERSGRAAGRQRRVVSQPINACSLQKKQLALAAPRSEQRLHPLFTIRRNERGATAVEYGLILALIFLAVAGAIGGVATTTVGMWGNVSNSVAAAH